MNAQSIHRNRQDDGFRTQSQGAWQGGGNRHLGRCHILRALCAIAAVFMLCTFSAKAYAQSANGVPPATDSQDKSAQKDASTSCEEGKNMCLNNNRYRCTNHRWKMLEECKNPAFCSSNPDTETICEDAKPCTEEIFCVDAEPCTERAYTCGNDNAIYQCQKGKWVRKKKCGSKSCEFDDQSARCEAMTGEQRLLEGGKRPRIYGDECHEGESKCISNAVIKCDHGFWEYDKICTEPMECKMDEKKRRATCNNPK